MSPLGSLDIDREHGLAVAVVVGDGFVAVWPGLHVLGRPAVKPQAVGAGGVAKAGLTIAARAGGAARALERACGDLIVAVIREGAGSGRPTYHFSEYHPASTQRSDYRPSTELAVTHRTNLWSWPTRTSCSSRTTTQWIATFADTGKTPSR